MIGKNAPQLEADEIDSIITSDSLSKSDSDNADEELLKWQKDEGKAFHCVKMAVIYGLPALAAVVTVVYFAHLLLPARWRWLTQEELAAMQGLVISILSGIATSLAVNHFFRKK